MSKGPGKVENLILAELRKGKPISVNQMAIAVLAARQGVKAEDTGIMSGPMSIMVSFVSGEMPLARLRLGYHTGGDRRFFKLEGKRSKTPSTSVSPGRARLTFPFCN